MTKANYVGILAGMWRLGGAKVAVTLVVALAAALLAILVSGAQTAAAQTVPGGTLDANCPGPYDYPKGYVFGRAAQTFTAVNTGSSPALRWW